MKKDKTLYAGEAIRRLREAQGMIQEELAHYSKLDRSFISDLERNVKTPSLSTIFKLAKGLKMEPEEVVKEIKKDNPDFDSNFEKEKDRSP
ncbi:helix-turn-helix transcriptional regulator [Neobacillus mesonae]|uniref:helix-turn-helix domain-containing protein n=1 Tax=Neobacillus mesonae TaxID=1193713 RepID=UPI002E202AF9|nr:helix-turn-helix transcriptional regulator [Neobacillus mesonae]